MKHIGILLTNTGTPDNPSTPATRRYLREFLSDPRIVQLPRILWLPILYGVILPFRAKKSAALYQSICKDNNLPLRSNMLKIATSMQSILKQTETYQYTVVVGMNYGNPSIETALATLKNIDELITLPLFPQYSNTSTASTYDRLVTALKKCPALPTQHFIQDYATHTAYINALCQSLKMHWQRHGKGEHLLISFHGIPIRYVKQGDPYAIRCEQTANTLAAALGLQEHEWTLCYQSQFGYDKWLQPSLNNTLNKLGQQGAKTVDVIAPGFSADCLETLEEIAEGGNHVFQEAGGVQLRYCPALNADSEYLVEILKPFLS